MLQDLKILSALKVLSDFKILSDIKIQNDPLISQDPLKSHDPLRPHDLLRLKNSSAKPRKFNFNELMQNTKMTCTDASSLTSDSSHDIIVP